MPGATALLARSHRAFARHTHDTFGLGVVEQGGQLSHSGRGQVEAGPGDVITVNPGEVHDGAPVGDRGRAWRILYLDPATISAAHQDVAEGGSEFLELTRPVVSDARIAHVIRALFEATRRDHDPIWQEELLLRAVAALVHQRTAAVPAPCNIARARNLIDGDPAAAITLEDLARVSGLSRFQIVRGFARATGLTPHAYIVQKRIDLARRLIANGAPLADTAASSGFSDQSHMTRIFTARYGVTPRAYAAAVR